MSERPDTAVPVIPYATPSERAALTAGDLFGVIVRTVGLLLTLWAIYTWIYFILVQTANAPTAGQSPSNFLVGGALWLICGLALLRGDWLVRFAYPRDRRQFTEG